MRRYLAVILICTFLIGSSALAAVRGHKSMYAAGTLTNLTKGQMGRLQTSESALVFSPDKGTAVTIPYTAITGMDYGEHAGRRIGSTIALGVTTLGVMALPMLLSKKKRHYLTVYFNNDPKVATEERDRLAKDPKAVAKGDVAAFEINKHDYADLISVLQAKTGVAVQEEESKR
ncbi:MAG: hypothetical protein ACRD2G_01945 [Terriglobia bacterium]